jgi:heme O synthase-like polyprenyltransferase
MTGSIYLWSVAALGLCFLFFACYVSRERTKLSAKMLLHVTVIYLPVVYAVMVANKIG